MKKPLLLGLVTALVAAVCAVCMLSAHASVSMSLIEYRRWPHGAKLRLTNGSQRPIRYLAEEDGTPAGSPILSLRKNSAGWTRSSLTLQSMTCMNPSAGKATELFFLMDPANPPKTGQVLGALWDRELKPGQHVDFFVRLDPDTPPRRIGTVYRVGQSKLAANLQSCLVRVKRWCRIKTTLPGQVEVWCPESLALSMAPQP